MTIRVGVIGTGSLGRVHARVFTQMPEAAMVGFVEPNDATAADVAAQLNVKRFDDRASLMREIDAAVIATPTVTHYDIAREMLEAGIDVMVEKPITTTIDDARRLIDLAAKHDRILQVGHVERYNPAITAIVDHVSNIRYIAAERLAAFVPRSLDIDVLLDLMIHDINLVLSLLGQDVEEVHAVGVPVLTEKVDIANVRLQLKNGAVANLTASRVSQKKVREIRFFSSDSYISVDTAQKQAKGYRLVGANIQPLEIDVDAQKEPIRAELESFLACVRDRSRPIVAGEDGLAAVAVAQRVAEAIDESMRKFRK